MTGLHFFFLTFQIHLVLFNLFFRFIFSIYFFDLFFRKIFQNFFEKFFQVFFSWKSYFSDMPSRSRSPSLPRARGDRSRSRDGRRSRSPIREDRGDRYGDAGNRRDRPRQSPRRSPRPAENATTIALLHLQQQQQKQLQDQAASLAAIHRHLGVG